MRTFTWSIILADSLAAAPLSVVATPFDRLAP